MSDENLVSAGGAKTRKLGIEYRLIPREGLRRLALRYTLGLRYGECNWKKGLLDKEFLDERKNHMIEHLLLYLEEGNEKDDNLAAVVWGCFALMEAEKVAKLEEAKNATLQSQVQTVRPVA